MRALEFFSGIGGFASAFPGEVVLAIDQDAEAMAAYKLNFSHPTLQKTLGSIDSEKLASVQADLWWASPPCQPFTRKGAGKALKDPRAKPFLSLLSHFRAVQPTFFILENVVGFAQSEAGQLLVDTFRECKYQYHDTIELCPTQFGIPNRRPRLYFLAGKEPLLSLRVEPLSKTRLDRFLEKKVSENWQVSPKIIQRFHQAMDIVNPGDKDVIAQTFCSGYGKSPVRCGSYIRTSPTHVRYFTPKEIQGLLGFPATFQFPTRFTPRQAWRKLGNSLSVPVVRAVINRIPGVFPNLF